VPSPEAPEWLLAEFALSYNAYQVHASIEVANAIASSVQATYIQTGGLPTHLDALRTTLFVAQRRQHYADQPSDTDPMVADLIDLISQLSDGEVQIIGEAL
jgi:hypothetical protein